MTQDEIEHMWKVASNNPNHDSNWHDPVIIAFARLVERRKCQELADKIQLLPFGDTASSFAAWVRSEA